MWAEAVAGREVLRLEVIRMVWKPEDTARPTVPIVLSWQESGCSFFLQHLGLEGRAFFRDQPSSTSGRALHNHG